MKRNVFYRILLCGLILGFFGSLRAQDSEDGNLDIKQGKGAKVMYIQNAAGGFLSSSISRNGKYMSGLSDSYNGFVYNIETNQFYYLNGAVGSVSNKMDIVGYTHSKMADPAMPFATAAIYKDGKWKTLELLSYDSAKLGTFTRTTNPQISADGNTVIATAFGIEQVGGKKMPYLQCCIYRDTQIAERLPHAWPVEESYYGSQNFCISADGGVIGGAGGWPIAPTNRSPIYWDKNREVHKLCDDAHMDGKVKGMSSDGSFKVGDMFDAGLRKACYWENGLPYHITKIPVGFDVSEFTGVSDNKLAVGKTYTRTGDRICAMIWTPDLGTVLAKDWLRELYGLDLTDSELGEIVGISADGLRLAGYSETFPYVIVLDTNPINSRPLELTGKQEKGTKTVNLEWAIPYKNGRTILGYNVYRNKEKVNTSLVLTTTYSDLNVPSGMCEYTVTAVYEKTGESSHSDSKKLQVIDPASECYSVKSIRADVEYNRTATIRWGLPSDQVMKKSASFTDYKEMEEGQNQVPKGAPDQNMFDVAQLQDMDSPSAFQAIKIGNEYYVGNFYTPGISVYNENWFKVRKVDAALPIAVGMAYDGAYLYVVCQTKYIYKVNLKNNAMELLTIVGADSLQSLQHIAYIPELNDGKGGFEIGDWKRSILIDKKANKLDEGIVVESCGSTAYHEGKIYAAEQTSKSLNILKVFNLSDKKLIQTFDLNTLPELKELSSKQISVGGISILPLADGTITLGVMQQLGEYEKNNKLAYMELVPMPDLTGYNIYRDGVKLNETPQTKRNYVEVFTEPTSHRYKVTAVFGSCESEMSDSVLVEIKTSTGCTPVKNLKVKEMYDDVVLSWERPTNYEHGTLLGFNLYKDGLKINENLYAYFTYQDVSPTTGSHTYAVECFYDNSCISKDSVKIEVTKAGQCAPVDIFNLKDAQISQKPASYKVDVKWELPSYDGYLPIRYDRGINVNTFGAPDGSDFSVAVAWDSSQLKMYKDYSIVGMEFFIAGRATVIPFLMIDDKVVYQKTAGKLPVSEFSTYLFDKLYPVSDVKVDMALGYSVSGYSTSEFPVGTDMGPALRRRGDLLSLDGMQTWVSAAATTTVDANWNIAALLIKERDLAAAKTQGETTPEIVKVPLVKPAKTSTTLEVRPSVTETKASSATIELKGFNVYRDNKKLNKDVLRTLSYSDSALTSGEYSYYVSTVWTSCDEIPSVSKIIELGNVSNENLSEQTKISIYPNPCKEILNISGNYARLSVIDMNGRELLNFSRKLSVDLSRLTPGFYTLRFILENGSVVYHKVAIQ